MDRLTSPPPNPAEQEWIADNLSRLRSDGVDIDDAASLGAHFDRAYREWAAFPSPLREDPNDAINRIGIGVGEHIRRRTGLEWAIATDEYGTELALVGQPGDVLIFPPNLVAKRWSDEGIGVLPNLIEMLLDSVTTLRRP
ncbi:MAG: hypothetical protein JWN61_1997 [Pseudonocardiales bacterium]|nr:hypothetical protein [Pseudonocardiales bacterium]